VPPYDAGKFPNKWRKMEPDRPARTLLAHLGKDGYSHIHYDSQQARPISVREAARLQSFPDGFVFSGTMNPAFRQIGNAVPPLLSWRIALMLKAQIAGRSFESRARSVAGSCRV
jgi:DNA (cytosine-5)-methyltransferase 1